MNYFEKLPNELQSFLQTSESMTLLDGYLRFLNPMKSEAYTFLAQQWQGWRGGIPFAITAFGDLIVWEEDGYVAMYRFLDNRVDIILSGFSFFFENIEDAEFQKDYFDIKLYRDVKQKIGSISNNECYTFEPIPSLGGSRDVSLLSKAQTLEYLDFVIKSC